MITTTVVAEDEDGDGGCCVEGCCGCCVRRRPYLDLGEEEAEVSGSDSDCDDGGVPLGRYGEYMRIRETIFSRYPQVRLYSPKFIVEEEASGFSEKSYEKSKKFKIVWVQFSF